MKTKDLAALVALAALWGSSFLFIRVAVPSFGPAPLAVSRVMLGAVLLAAFAAITRRPLVLRPYVKQLLVLGAINAALPFVLIGAAELHITASFAAVLTATVPLFAALFSVVWLGERMTMVRVTGLLVGVVGVAIMVGWSPLPLTLATGLGIVAMLLGSASYAASGIFARRRLAGVPTHTLALGQQLGALAWLALPALVWAPRTVPPPIALWAVLGLGVLSTAFAYLLYFRLIERVGPTKTATVTYLLPVFGLLWGALFLGEPVTGGMATGLALILASVVLVNEVQLPSMVTQTLRRGLTGGAVAPASGLHSECSAPRAPRHPLPEASESR